MNIKFKNFVCAVLLTVGIYTVLYLLSRTILADVYLFDWTAHNKYLYFWLISLLFIFWKKYFVAFYITFGNLVAIIIGELLGDLIIFINSFRISPGLDPMLLSHYQTHYGVFIWLALVLIAWIMGVRREFPKK